ncbi:hypothetical protein C9374_013066 [Naegleria lovaniensis]|uniref:AB hydrolase-1 domain-containing protein n=1 Tax=Naegleria lovaniensis TaxID=51637 RepID=A0AA88KDE2_NAELO|nr:uncharacterized protein C9374_013066 [Naegleria lovaniensis]KAG2372859.1 hypothetical protein C9374_013066 [Naegleria lovaniensis]
MSSSLSSTPQNFHTSEQQLDRHSLSHDRGNRSMEENLPQFHEHQQDEMFSSDHENPFRIDPENLNFEKTDLQMAKSDNDTDGIHVLEDGHTPNVIHFEEEMETPALEEYEIQQQEPQPTPQQRTMRTTEESLSWKDRFLKVFKKTPSRPSSSSLVAENHFASPPMTTQTTKIPKKTVGWESSQDQVLPRFSKIARILHSAPSHYSSGRGHISHRKHKISGSIWFKCIHGLFKVSTLILLYMEIVYLILFIVALVHSLQNKGFFAGGNSLNVLWLSLIFMILNALFIWDSFGDYFMLYCFFVCCRNKYLKRMEQSERKMLQTQRTTTGGGPSFLRHEPQPQQPLTQQERGVLNSPFPDQNSTTSQPQIQISPQQQQQQLRRQQFHHKHHPKYYSPLMYYEWKLIWFILTLITCSACLILIVMIYVCDAFLGNDRVSGWFAFCFLASLMAYFFISWHEFILARHDHEYTQKKLVKRRLLFVKWDWWTCVKFLSKIGLLFGMWLVIGSIFILVTIQAVFTAKTLSYIDLSGGAAQMVTIKPPKSSRFQLHLYCEGPKASDDIILLDADVGIACPKCYFQPFVELLATNGMRVCVLERAGYGFSYSGPFPRNLGNETAAEVAALMRETFLGQTVVMISHSSATFTSRTLLQYYPKLLRAVILLHPAHERLEERVGILKIYNQQERLKQKKEEFLNQLNTLRFQSALGLTLFPGVLKPLHSKHEELLERYYLGGVKSYVLSFPEFKPNSNITVQYASVLRLTNFIDAVWSEMSQMPLVFEFMKQLRTSDKFFDTRNETPHPVNATRVVRHHAPIPFLILTSRFLMNGTCEENRILMMNNFATRNETHDEVLCQHWKEHVSLYAQLFRELHGDLFEYYASPKTKWEFIEADYDMALTHPFLLMPYVKQALELSKS